MKKRLGLTLCALVAVITVCALALTSCGDDTVEQQTNGGNTTTDGGQTTESSKPYDKTIGNGNYILHNFIGNEMIQPNKVVDVTDNYLKQGGTYVKGLASKLDNSLKGRPAAQNYFGDLINAVQNDNYFFIDRDFPSGPNLDRAANTISKAAEPYFVDIIKNLDTPSERGAFYYSYQILANEAYKEGIGANQNYASVQMNTYNVRKQSTIDEAQYNSYFADIDLEQEYGNNNFRQVTNLMDAMVDNAVTNMNNRQSLNLQATDLRQMINLAMTTDSLEAMHDVTKANLKHNNCGLTLGIVTVMGKTAEEAFQTEQEQGKSY